MLTRREDLIRTCLELEKRIPEWERQSNIFLMDREELEMYTAYLREEKLPSLED